VRRLLDIALASAGLAVGGPLLAALAAAVKLDTPGPALFKQTRVGRDFRPITIFKLRTMTVDASGAQITAAGDRRVTRVGALLRRTKLDELPQLWNVLRGDMSIVGPRPEVPRYVSQYRDEWRALLSVRPGLTDIASLTFRDEERLLALAHDRERAYTEIVMPLKLGLALSDLPAQSVAHDLAVIARTALAVVRPRPDVDPIIREAERRIAAQNREGLN
jgi:lipopolysaccharide/colanic/teichoic acid biosynthesis glycosyltransferase